MNKKGFTLIEVIVSVVLVSIVMVSLTASLVELKKTSEVVTSNTDAVIASAIVSRVINKDVAENEGIKFIDCDANGEECGMVLGNNAKRSITIKNTSDESLVTVAKKSDNSGYYLKKGSDYYNKVDITFKDSEDISKCTNILANCISIVVEGNECKCFKEKKSTTLLYKDISSSTSTELSSEGGKNVYIKTLTYIKTTDHNTNKVTTNGYGFSRLYYDQRVYDTRLSNEQNVLTKLVIGIYDGNDRNDETYNVNLFAASRIGSDTPSVGKKIVVRLNTVGNIANPDRIRVPQIELNGYTFGVERLEEVFNIGFDVTNLGVGEDYQGLGDKTTITEMSAPCIAKETNVTECDPDAAYHFRGYYTQNAEVGEPCAGVQVLSETINDKTKIKVAPNYFLNDTVIYACWN